MNIATGDHCAIGGQDVPYAQVDAVGEWVAFTVRREGEDSDIFIAKIGERSGCPSWGARLLKRKGDQILPVLSPDAEWIFFAEQSRRDETWSVRRVQAHLVTARDTSELLCSDLPEVNRLNVFPDGKRILASTEGGLYVVPAQGGKAELLSLPAFQDPSSGHRLRVREAAVSPDGLLIAFTGVDIEDKRTPPMSRIYICHLDGSALKRVTPLEESPIEPYIFPESGKSAYDLAKQRWDASVKAAAMQQQVEERK